MGSSARRGKGGQILVVFGAASIVMLAIASLVIDGGMAFAQRRNAQNGSDLAALAAVRIMASGGTDTDVVNILTTTAQANGATVKFGAANQGPQYIDRTSTPTGWVGSGTIPRGSRGVRVPASVTFGTYLARAVGINTWTATTLATARYRSPTENGGMFPFGISEASFDSTQPGHFTICPPDEEPVSRGGTCPDQQLNESGGQNAPGQFGWLKFGAQNNCNGFGLGMSTNSGCPNGAPSGFLQGEIDGNSYGCCTAVTGGPAPADHIGGFQGHNGNGGNDCSVPIASEQTFIMPVWDQALGNGNSGRYHIVGFVGFQVTLCTGANSATGVWRLEMFSDPQNIPIPPGESVSIRLLK